MNHYKIELYDVTYHVEPYVDDGEIFAVIHRADGLEQFGSDELPGLFDEATHIKLSRLLAEALMEANDEH